MNHSRHQRGSWKIKPKSMITASRAEDERLFDSRSDYHINPEHVSKTQAMFLRLSIVRERLGHLNNFPSLAIACHHCLRERWKSLPESKILIKASPVFATQKQQTKLTQWEQDATNTFTNRSQISLTLFQHTVKTSSEPWLTLFNCFQRTLRHDTD